jgi:hypothetical protein
LLTQWVSRSGKTGKGNIEVGIGLRDTIIV